MCIRDSILGAADKTIIDTGPAAGPGVVPYLPLNSLPQTPQAPTGDKP